jgi:hypothetical protein
MQALRRCSCQRGGGTPPTASRASASRTRVGSGVGHQRKLLLSRRLLQPKFWVRVMHRAVAALLGVQVAPQCSCRKPLLQLQSIPAAWHRPKRTLKALACSQQFHRTAARNRLLSQLRSSCTQSSSQAAALQLPRTARGCWKSITRGWSHAQKLMQRLATQHENSNAPAASGNAEQELEASQPSVFVIGDKYIGM